MVALLGEAACRRYGGMATVDGARAESALESSISLSPTWLAAGRVPGRQDTVQGRLASIPG